MPITIQQKKKILQVVNVFETGSPTGNYASVTLLQDGPIENGKPIKQITYGRSQTTEFGNLKALLQEYVKKNGTFSNDVKPFLPQIGKKPSLCTNKKFLQILKDSAIKDPIMAQTQDVFFDTLYYQPAFNWFNSMKFTLPLSLLVIYDSQIHSGGIPAFLRERFTEPTPKNGGDEKKWIEEYVNVRHTWLAHHPKPILKNTIYRTSCFKDAITHNNWNLNSPIIAHGKTVA